MGIKVESYALSAFDTIKIMIESAVAPMHRFLPAKSRHPHAYCIGLPRSGTHSLGYMFTKNFTSQHEAASHDTCIHILRWLNGEYTDNKIRDILQARDKYFNLQVEATHFLYLVISHLVELYPESKYILTIRDPYSWLNSEINQNFRTTKNYPFWRALEEYRYKHIAQHSPTEEKLLKEYGGVYPVDSYLSYWRTHIKQVIDNVPSHRLLILKTGEIRNSIDLISDFLDIDSKQIDATRSHSGINDNKEIDIYKYVSKDYVRERVNAICYDLVSELFPEQQELL